MAHSDDAPGAQQVRADKDRRSSITSDELAVAIERLGYGGPWAEPGHFRAGDSVLSTEDDISGSVVYANDYLAFRVWGGVHLPSETGQGRRVRHADGQCPPCAADIDAAHRFDELHAPAWTLIGDHTPVDPDSPGFRRAYDLRRGYGFCDAAIDWPALIAAHPDRLVAVAGPDVVDLQTRTDAICAARATEDLSVPTDDPNDLTESVYVELWCCGDGRIAVDPGLLPRRTAHTPEHETTDHTDEGVNP